jgi:hypothetical protein
LLKKKVLKKIYERKKGIHYQTFNFYDFVVFGPIELLNLKKKKNRTRKRKIIMNSFFFILVCLAYQMAASYFMPSNGIIITKKSVREGGGKKKSKIQLGSEKFFTFIAINFV